ncbi:DUF1439 domain-containing protein [Stenotrophomonas mori]|uniref:DUF1439 domain-containing protein n=1 Tax=Stenotrophomonas mori TaxID=2871096 RepID=A0ABT0SK39_9GAMM|nr:DUF1439 domain-containing protein [Stenotrophomonas mori]MCL7715688.1 DUF1439 domain-containing protein [Stenotrophomonas mori]
MNLRTLLLPAACLAVAASVQAAPRLDGHRLVVEAADVQQYLDGSFPRSQKALGGLLALTVSQPRLTLPAGSRLDLQFDLAAGAGGGAPRPVGNVQLSSGLRYDAQTRGFHLDQPSVETFRPAVAGAELDSATRGLLNTWLADYARREPIYRIEPAIANVMGALQVKTIGIENGRIAVDFNKDLGALVPQGLLGH